MKKKHEYFGFGESGSPLICLGSHETFDEADEAAEALIRQGMPIVWIDTKENWHSFLINSLNKIHEMTVKNS